MTKTGKRLIALALTLAALAALVFGALWLTDLRIISRHPALTADMMPAAAAQNGLPDLSALGIDTADFTRSDEPFERPLFHGTLMSEGSVPTVKWDRYVSSSGAMLVFDEQGRLRVFSNEPNIRAGKTIGTDTYYDFQLRKKAHALLADLVGDFAHFRDDLKTSQSVDNGSGYYFSMERSPAEGAADAASITMSIDGKVRTIQIDYCDITDSSKTAALDAEFEAYLSAVPTEYGGNYVSAEKNGKTYLAYQDTIYGIYSFTVNLTGGALDSQQLVWSVK